MSKVSVQGMLRLRKQAERREVERRHHMQELAPKATKEGTCLVYRGVEYCKR